MILHVFNPEHDIALACGRRRFTPPKAARELRRGLAFLPALWAAEGDAVLADLPLEAEARAAAAAGVLKAAGLAAPRRVRFVAPREAGSLPLTGVSLWGCDAAAADELRRCGVAEELLPDAATLETVRRLSHRRTGRLVLEALAESWQERGGPHAGAGADSLSEAHAPLCGETAECLTTGELEAFAAQRGGAVAKAPWSCSGRGVKFLSAALSDAERSWAANVIRAQGSVMAERRYRKVADFGMEFVSAEGGMSYRGLSLFRTEHGAYTGNVVATEAAKELYLRRYAGGGLLDWLKDELCRTLGRIYNNVYRGPMGVDMMIVDTGNAAAPYAIHPCVEVNLRRTMGHAALDISPTDGAEIRLMTFTNQKITIQPIKQL